MTRKFSLAHLTVLGCDPAQATHIAADVGYDFVSFRTIPLGLPGEPRYALSENRKMLRETKASLTSTGMTLLDIEVARISNDHDVNDYRPALETAAELGAKHVIVCAYSKDREHVAAEFARLCNLAAPLSLTVDLEYITFSDVSDFQSAWTLVRDSRCANAGVLVDTLHFDRSRTTFAELDATPSSRFHFAQLCDAPAAVSPTREEMMRTAREERLFPGEGDIPLREIAAHMPEIPFSLEIAHRKRQQELGYKEFARQCLQKARAYFDEND